VKYCVLIIDGAAGLPLTERGNKTCLELARTPNLDRIASEGYLGLVRTVPPGMEPSSAIACMSVIGYDPERYYDGRASIEARSLGIGIGEGETVFRCNLVAVEDGRMLDYSAGHIGSDEASKIVSALNEALGNDEIEFFPGVGYRHILKLRGYGDSLKAVCIPPHDIPGKSVAEYLPRGEGSGILRDLMARSEEVLRGHPVNRERKSREAAPATMIWLFWGSGPLPEMPSFEEAYGLKAAMTSGVDLLKGLAQMAQMTVLQIPGVTDGPDNDYTAQAEGALDALKEHDLVVAHIEAPDEAAHGGSADEKIEAIERVDAEVAGRLLDYRGDAFRVLVMPDHPTPIALRTHTDEPVPFMIWGDSVAADGAVRFTEKEAAKTGVFIEEGYKIMGRLVGK
jgi:2,3-bisphosphoglycerate-independent phosphoglycerate mutase